MLPSQTTPGFDALLPQHCWLSLVTGARLFESVDIISCVMQFLCMDVWLPDNSGISEPLFVHMPDLVIYVINWTGMVHMNHPRGVCLVASIDVRLESTFVHYLLTVLWDNGLYDTLIDRRTTLDLRRDKGVEVMTLVGDVLGVCF